MCVSGVVKTFFHEQDQDLFSRPRPQHFFEARPKPRLLLSRPIPKSRSYLLRPKLRPRSYLPRPRPRPYLLLPRLRYYLAKPRPMPNPSYDIGICNRFTIANITQIHYHIIKKFINVWVSIRDFAVIKIHKVNSTKR